MHVDYDHSIEVRSKTMFKRILVPLDGSKRAEQAIPVATRLAKAYAGSITFVQVVTANVEGAWLAMATPDFMQKAFEVNSARANDYLIELSKSPELNGFDISLEVQAGLPAQAILSAAESNKADLIVMCSHGDTGVKRWMLGSVAQKVVRYSPVPVLVLREDGNVLPATHTEEMSSLRILVPLDGSALAEAALTPAAYLCATLSAPAQGILHLARVIRLPDRYDYGQHDSLAEAIEKERLQANAYLSSVMQRLHEGEFADLNLEVISTVVVNMDVASTLIGMAEFGDFVEDVKVANGCEMIAMATHGRSGLERWMMGSVTERMLGATKLPLLIVRPQKTNVEPEKTSEKVETETGVQSWAGLF
jgi:nucleotide-binding universal stress UspA family protein